jgi:hypothetical protein
LEGPPDVVVETRSPGDETIEKPAIEIAGEATTRRVLPED